MRTISGYGGERRPQSGGKILRQRRSVTARTPYDRPPPALLRSNNLPEQNPSWISRFVFKPARAIASGAGKIISSVVFSDSSSSSSSSSDADSASDIDADEVNSEDLPEDETTYENQQPMMQRTSSKHVIEQLLTQETFGREESDRLMNIIKARIVDHPTIPASEERMQTRLNVPSNAFTSDVTGLDMSSKAVMEARKWFEEKKSGSSSKLKSGFGSPLLNSCVSPHVTESEAGSPVDMAKSYMQARPPWTAASSPAGKQLLKDETPFSYSTGHLSSSKLKRGPRLSQSWNIQEEMRKVRAKATEEMLRKSSKTPSSSTWVLKDSAKDTLSICTNAKDASLSTDEGTPSSYQAEYNVEDNQVKTAEADLPAEWTRSTPNISHVGGESKETLISEGIKLTEDTNDALQWCSTVALGLSANTSIPKDVSEINHYSALKESDTNGLPSSTPRSPMAVEGPTETDMEERSQPVTENSTEIPMENGAMGDSRRGRGRGRGSGRGRRRGRNLRQTSKEERE